MALTPAATGLCGGQPQPGWGRGVPVCPGSSGLACWLPRDPGALLGDRSPR